MAGAGSEPAGRAPEPRFLNAGEAALVVEFGAAIDPAIHDRVLALDAALAAAEVPGVRETVPTFRSLMIHYEPLEIGREALVGRLNGLDASAGAAPARARWTVPCCYDPAFAEDLGYVALTLKLAPERVVALHEGATYRAYMYGFAPGYCYLGGLAPELSISRRASPRPPAPPNVILMAGGMTLIATISMPTGWWLVGRTPERLFAPARDPAFLVGVGDTIRFEGVDRATFEALEARAGAGEVVARVERP